MSERQYTLTEAAEMLDIVPRALRHRIKTGHAQATGTLGGYRMTLAQIRDAKRNTPKAGRPRTVTPAAK